ncbi:hypothetical protein L917_16462 [Phytophthora nicotianae]|uniref:Uncharacterized protein n=1 Tax=Phytophthora nicotianae TaxID=4792 RepID=W2G1Y9_PHYNI|nr:hypothetical protein L915_16733 [Phytophthora nicotianae]ETL30361.1 hypothetical protein L916_16642 [Phytophthora nicotianae]ETL83597.1 hypothetical protein L917_16462 [Phytophthora nicotianae]ETM36799.1 hypothetical protein L914_16567 [Phytophthora nicotianae]
MTPHRRLLLLRRMKQRAKSRKLLPLSQQIQRLIV